MIEFPTLEETRINEVVAAIEKMHYGAPVSAKRIGAAAGLSGHQTLIYLHMVDAVGRAKPVRTKSSDVTRGWVPAQVDASMSLADERATLAADTLAADTLAKLRNGDPLSEQQVAEAMEQPIGTVGRWLTDAETMGLNIGTETHRGWMPISS
ncbi:hypothetical protein Pla52o_39310 [Novipirellula galeiformis]|uniref:LexA repressor n=1 Tax=Novipirellula galeiformis TaxID=2528004 RepID=A0A5C6CE16_9BACT|nr:hypothetical protein [Novipirellula galeiformis]TWU21744.1 hypothetical protein Pla52o_39310 [Novipirellula galeiformis]